MKTRGVDELRAQRTDECHTCLITMIAQLLFTKSSFLNERVCTLVLNDLHQLLFLFLCISFSLIIQHCNYIIIQEKSQSRIYTFSFVLISGMRYV